METIWIKNKQTGNVWEVSGELADRLLTDADYEKVDAPTAEEPKAEEPKAAASKTAGK